MKAQAHPPLQNLQGPPSLTIVPVCFFFGSGAVQKLFRSHPSRSPHPEETIRTSPSSPAGRGREAGQQRPRGAPPPPPAPLRGPPRPPGAPLTGAALGPPDLPQEQDHGQEVAQVAEDTEHVHVPARGPCARAQATPGNFAAAEAAAASLACPWVPRGPARAAESRTPPGAPPLCQRALGRAVTWPGRPQRGGARKRRRPRSRPRPIPAPRLPAGGAARPGWGLPAGPAARRSVPARGPPRPAPLMPAEVAAQSPSSASPPQPGVLPA